MDRLSPWPVHPQLKGHGEPTWRTVMDIDGLPPRIGAKIQLDESTGCWIWTAGASGGYGQTWLNQDRWQIHRLIYTILVRELSDAEVIDHLCRRKRCCNPAHLEPVSVAENSRRARQRSEFCPKGHVKELVCGRWICRQCDADRKQKRWRDPAFRQREQKRQQKRRRDPAVRQRDNAVRRALKRSPGPGQAPLF